MDEMMIWPRLRSLEADSAKNVKAYEQSNIITSVIRTNAAADISMLGYRMMWASSLTPAKSDLLNAKITTAAAVTEVIGSATSLHAKSDDNYEMIMDGVFYTCGLYTDEDARAFLLLVVYSAGKYSVDFNGSTLTVVFPKVGTYLSSPWGDFVEGEEDDLRFITTIEWTTIHQIDPKFIPGAVLPVVELTTAITANTGLITLTDAENAALNKAIGLPCIVKFNVSSMPYTVLCSYAVDEDLPMFNGTFSNLTINLVGSDGVWMCACDQTS